MPPKKKSMINPIIYGVCLVLAIFLAIHGALVFESVKQMVEMGEIAKNQQVLTFVSLIFERIEDSPFSISYNQYTPTSLLYCIFAWLIVVLMIENSKKNYIRGKEFGTSKWGTLATIRDLFASSIEAAEIKRAKRMRTPLGKWREKSKLFKQCEKNGRIIQKAKLEELKYQEKTRKQNHSDDKKLYREQQEEIRREVRESVELDKRRVWEPYRLKADYESHLQEINESPSLADDEKRQRVAQAKKDYDNELRDFYSYPKRVAKIKEKYKDADMLFTRTERISFHNWMVNQNTLILGGSGSGKTRGFVMPNVLQAHSSYVITDPKGEILEKAGYFLSEVKGYKIRVLNLNKKTESDGYNPFIYIHPEREGYEERVLSLIETIIINTDGGEKKGGSDPFWDKAERLFLQAIFFFVTDGFVPEERNMNTVLKLIRMLQIAEEEDNMNSDLDVFVRIFTEKYGEEHIGVQQYREFREKASGKTAKSIVISAVARLAPFRTSAVQKIFSYDSMHLDLVGEEKTAVFVVVPPTDPTFNFIAGMLFTQLFQELEYCATQKYKHKGQRLKVPVRFILDEFANTATIPNFVKILAYARSFGIGITPILQSLEQIKNMYKDEWGVIVDNCNTLLYLGSITHMDTLEYMSKLLGKGTFDKRTTGRTRGRSGSSSQNFDVIGRELMDSSEIRKLPKKDCLFIVGGRDPFYSEKYDYTSHPNYRFTSDANKEYSFHYKPEQPPEKKQKEVEEIPHREEAAVLTPSDNAYVEIKPIVTDTSPTNQLARVTKQATTLGIISDEEIAVEDGEDITEEINEKTFLALVDEEEVARQEAKLTVSEETQAYLNKLRDERIRVEESLIQTVNRLGRTYRTLEPISNEELSVEDGEEAFEVDEKALAFVMDDDSQASAVELEDVLADAGAILSGFGDISESDV